MQSKCLLLKSETRCSQDYVLMAQPEPPGHRAQPSPPSLQTAGGDMVVGCRLSTHNDKARASGAPGFVAERRTAPFTMGVYGGTSALGSVRRLQGTKCPLKMHFKIETLSPEL